MGQPRDTRIINGGRVRRCERSLTTRTGRRRSIIAEPVWTPGTVDDDVTLDCQHAGSICYKQLDFVQLVSTLTTNAKIHGWRASSANYMKIIISIYR